MAKTLNKNCISLQDWKRRVICKNCWLMDNGPKVGQDSMPVWVRVLLENGMDLLISGTGSFRCPSICHRHGWTYQGLYYPVTQTWLDIPRPLLPSHTDTAGHTKAFDYPVTQTRLDIPKPLITQSHRHGWTYQGLWSPSHTDTAGHTKAFDYPVTQTRLDIPRSLITQPHRHGWTYQGHWLPSHTDTAVHTKAFDYPVTQTRLDIPRPLITQSWTTGGKVKAVSFQVPHGFELTICRSTVEHANHQTTMTPVAVPLYWSHCCHHDHCCAM